MLVTPSRTINKLLKMLVTTSRTINKLNVRHIYKCEWMRFVLKSFTDFSDLMCRMSVRLNHIWSSKSLSSVNHALIITFWQWYSFSRHIYTTTSSSIRRRHHHVEALIRVNKQLTWHLSIDDGRRWLNDALHSIFEYRLMLSARLLLDLRLEGRDFLRTAPEST